MATGRTVDRWTRFCVDDSGGTPREIGIDTLSPVGFTYDTVDLTAFQDAVKGYLAGHPDAPITVTGPWSNTTPAVAISATGVAPVLSGSHDVWYPGLLGGGRSGVRYRCPHYYQRVCMHSIHRDGRQV
jgi:hypothetical protein